MEIKILGTGCTKCKSLERKVRELVEQHNLDVEVKYVDDLNEMVEAGIMMTPGLIIDGEVKSFGIVPKEKQLLEWLKGE